MALENMDKKPIGLCVCKIYDEATDEICKSICSAAAAKGYHVVIFTSSIDFFFKSAYTESAKNIFRLINFNNLSGVIILSETIKDSTISEKLAAKAKAAGIPAVSIDGKIKGCINVLFEYERCFEQIVRHIVEYHKLKNVYFLAGIKYNDFSERRLAVYKKVLRENNIPIDEKKIGYGDFWEMPAAAEVNRFLDECEGVLPDAIICANDSMAITACKVITQRGLSVPEDIIVTGFDGILREKYHTPRLTTARANNAAVGEKAADALIDAINGNAPKEDIIVPFDVVFSQSCGCKPIIYKNVNDVVSELYEEIRAKDELIISMNSMTNTVTRCDDVAEAVANVEHYIGVVYFTEMIVNFRKEVFSPESDFDFSIPIEIGEKMLHAVRFDRTVPNILMEEYKCGDFYSFENATGHEEQKIVFLVQFQEKVYGYVTISFYPNSIKFNTLNIFAMNLNLAINTVKNKSDILAKNKSIEEAYVHDSMTGLLNRRGFYKKIKEHTGGYVFAVSVDLDGLKYINDTFGHSEGDYAIKKVGEIISACCGDEGICARFGGDEFVAVLMFSEDNPDIMHAFKMKFSELIDKANKESHKGYEISASMGSIFCKLTNDIDLDTAIKKADDKMYKDKESKGINIRNREEI